MFYLRISLKYLFFLFIISCSKSEMLMSDIDINFDNKQVSFSKNSKLYTGVILEYYDNKQIKIEINVINGLKEGYVKQFHKN